MSRLGQGRREYERGGEAQSADWRGAHAQKRLDPRRVRWAMMLHDAKAPAGAIDGALL